VDGPDGVRTAGQIVEADETYFGNIEKEKSRAGREKKKSE
jgi:hypothetical protein